MAKQRSSESEKQRIERLQRRAQERSGRQAEEARLVDELVRQSIKIHGA